MFNFKTILRGLVASALLVVLFEALEDRRRTYNQHNVGISVFKDSNFPNLTFPAVSICSSYYDTQRLREDLGDVKINPFTGQTKEWLWQTSPVYAYDRMSAYDFKVNMTTFLDEYYLSLDQIMIKSNENSIAASCVVGGVPCQVFWGNEAKQYHVNGTLITEVV